MGVLTGGGVGASRTIVRFTEPTPCCAGKSLVGAKARRPQSGSPAKPAWAGAHGARLALRSCPRFPLGEDPPSLSPSVLKPQGQSWQWQAVACLTSVQPKAALTCTCTCRPAGLSAGAGVSAASLVLSSIGLRVPRAGKPPSLPPVGRSDLLLSQEKELLGPQAWALQGPWRGGEEGGREGAPPLAGDKQLRLRRGIPPPAPAAAAAASARLAMAEETVRVSCCGAKLVPEERPGWGATFFPAPPDCAPPGLHRLPVTAALWPNKKRDPAWAFQEELPGGGGGLSVSWDCCLCGSLWLLQSPPGGGSGRPAQVCRCRLGAS